MLISYQINKAIKIQVPNPKNLCYNKNSAKKPTQENEKHDFKKTNSKRFL